MSCLAIVDAKALEKILLMLGSKKERQKGSNVFCSHPDSRYTTIPHHSGINISRPLLRSILKEIKVSIEEFPELLKRV
jgi:predicted RNA binding protein YcfA (HicA-like mRNA interferase family)